MRAHTITTTKLALLLSLLALGALGLVACGGGDDNQTTGASETETTRDELAADNKSCGSFGRYRFAVVEGDISCRVARRVMDGMVHSSAAVQRLPGAWICSGPDSPVECFNEAGETIRARFAKEAKLSREQVQELKAKLSREQVQELKREANIKAKLSREQVQELKREANTWASLFATNACNRYMGQPLCERLGCVRHVVTPIENCTPVSAAFQKSFADATVEDIKSERIVLVGWADRPLYEAAVKFSNGEVVVFVDTPPGGCPGGPCKWGIEDHNRRFLEAAAPRE